MKIDRTNIDIMKLLKDGRRSYGEIAQIMSVTENTVRARVNRMKAEGVLDICGLVDPESLPGHSIAYVAVKLNTMHLVKKGQEFARLRGVVSVGVVTGRYDLILVVFFNESFGLLEFFTEEVDPIEDVQSCETFVVYKGYDLKIPYIL